MKPDSKIILKWSSQYLRTPKMYSRTELLNLVLISLLLFNDKKWDDNAFNVIWPTCDTTPTSAISISVDKHSYWPASLALLVTASRGIPLRFAIHFHIDVGWIIYTSLLETSSVSICLFGTVTINSSINWTIKWNFIEEMTDRQFRIELKEHNKVVWMTHSYNVMMALNFKIVKNTFKRNNSFSIG